MCVCVCVCVCMCVTGEVDGGLTERLSQENKSQETLYLTLASTQTFFLSLPLSHSFSLSLSLCDTTASLSIPLRLPALEKRGVKATAVRATSEQKLPLTLSAVKETAMTLLGVQTSSWRESLMLFHFISLLIFEFIFKRKQNNQGPSPDNYENMTLQYDN